jgi:acyl-CoA dehydrogenase
VTDAWRTPSGRRCARLARDVVAKEVAPHVAQWERDGELPRSLHRTFADAGLLGVSFPEEQGGGGGDSVDSAILTEEVLLGGGSGGVVASLFTHGIAVPHMSKNGRPPSSTATSDRRLRARRSAHWP